MNEWERNGCEVCRHLWEAGQAPPEIAVNIAEHTSLHRCEVCGTLWEQHERYADVISEGEAKLKYALNSSA